MTAYLAIVQPDAAYLVSDGAACGADHRLDYVTSKPTLFPDLGLAVALTGYTRPDWIGEAMASIAPVDQVDAIRSLPLVAHLIAGRNCRAGIPSPDVVMVAIGWHELHGAGAWTCATGEAATRRGWKPYAVHCARAMLEDIADPSAVLGRPVDLFDPASFDPATDGLALMQDCRSRPADPDLYDGRSDVHLIGGHVDLVTASRDGLSRRLLATWPEDRVGHLINPHRKEAA